MASAIDKDGHLEFSQDDNMIRRLKDLGIEWDEKDVRVSDIDLSDNRYQTRLDAGSTDEEFVLRYKAAYGTGDRLPMPLVVVPFSARNQRDAKSSPCCGRHRLEAARRAGAKTMRLLRALPKCQGDIDALRDLSLFDNAANGKSISEDETYSYCAEEIVRKHGGLPAGMPDAKFITAEFRRWDGRGVKKERVTMYVKAYLAKRRCEVAGVHPPARMVEAFSDLFSWWNDAGFDDLSRQFCRFVDDPDVRKVLHESKRKRRSAAATLAELVSASRGYRDGRRQKMDAVAVIRFRCDDIRKAISKLDEDMSLDFAKLDDVQRQIETLFTESEEAVGRLRSKLGGFVHA
jgi:hypothetical protein